MKYKIDIYRILRITAWLLVIATLLTLFSGVLTTNYFIAPWVSYSTFYYIHTVIIPVIFLPLFYLHTLTGLLVLTYRNRYLNKTYIRVLTGVFWSVIIIVFVINLPYSKPRPVYRFRQG